MNTASCWGVALSSWFTIYFRITGTIHVPFAHQTELSGIHDRQPHEVGEQA